MTAALLFVDASVLLYAVDDRDTAQRDRARAWLTACWQRRCGRLSTQVLSEFYSHARAQFPSMLSAGDARAEVRRYQHWKPWAIDHATVESAWAFESRWQLAYSDAVILASAQQQGCTWLLSDQFTHGQAMDGITIVSPFLAEPSLLDAAPPT